MSAGDTYRISRLQKGDIDLMQGVLDLFGEVFDEHDTYAGARPDQDYLERLLGGDVFVALAALVHGRVVGALAAYVLPKFEQPRGELYIYDLAVDAAYRRRGIATALIGEARAIAAERGCHVVFVQADHGDDPAISLYTKLGRREDVLHFDIPVEK